MILSSVMKSLYGYMIQEISLFEHISLELLNLFFTYLLHIILPFVQIPYYNCTYKDTD